MGERSDFARGSGVEAPTVVGDNRLATFGHTTYADIARRIAKYRESLRIPSSVERKRKLAHGL